MRTAKFMLGKRLFYALFSALVLLGTSIQGQVNSNKYPVNSFKSLSNQNLRTTQSANSSIDIPLSQGKLVNGKVNINKTVNGVKTFIGSISNKQNSTFIINSNNGNITGYAILQDEKTAFEYSTENGQTYVEEVDINKLLCVDFDKSNSTNNNDEDNEDAAPALDANTLESFPNAIGCVLIDFDGQVVSGTYWNGGNTINAVASNHSDAQKIEIWEIASEDLRPFSINVTTSEAVFQTYPKNRRMRTIVTTTTTAAPGSGGVAYIGSFSWNDETPCWVFNQSTKACGETVSHEVGHTLDVRHDGHPGGNYYYGHADWAPIMGAGFNKDIVHWSKGEYTGANNQEDDLALITATKFGVGYRTDDHSNNTSSATALTIATNGDLSADLNKGIIEQNTDLDYFSFTTSGGQISLDVKTVNRHGNLDVLAKLYNSAGTQIGAYDNTGLHSAINTTLTAGNYFLSVEGTGEGDVNGTGYSDYGSLGCFFISGNIPVENGGNNLPIVSITNPTDAQVFNAPGNITINATASVVGGTITQVEFFVDGVSVGIDNNSPYSATYASTVGSHIITAVATEADSDIGNATPVNITVEEETTNTCTDPAWLSSSVYTTGMKVSYNGFSYRANYWTSGQQPDLFSGPYQHWTNLGACSNENQAPSVSITSPANSSVFTDPATITVSANASDADGTVSQVEFFSGTTSLGVVTGAGPYSVNYSPSVGNHNLTAVATDNDGATTTSSIVTITVEAYVNTPPVVSITSPSNNSTFTDPASFSITANASDNGSIAQVEFFSGTTSLGVVTGAGPYSVNYSPTVGNHNLTAVATDNDGATTTSSIVTITVEAYVNTPPVVSITSPSNNSTFTDPAAFSITANASDNGSIAQVEFFSGTTSLGIVTGAGPYSVNYSPAIGTYNLTAVATDDEGATTTSSIVVITVEEYVNQNPTIQITAPTEGSTLTQGSDVLITTSTNDVDGTVDLVEFFINQTRVGHDLTPPFDFNWTNLPLGNYAIFAIATDNDNGVTTSTTINVVVTEPNTCSDPEWQASSVYVAGNKVSFNGVSYKANWWTSGNQPDLNSGPWQVWTNLGACGPVFQAAESSNGQVKISTVEENYNWNIYPNPTSKAFNLNVNFSNPTNVQVSITNLTGSLVGNYTFNNAPSINESINIEGLNKGIYYVSVNVNGNTSTKKLIIK